MPSIRNGSVGIVHHRGTRSGWADCVLKHHCATGHFWMCSLTWSEVSRGGGWGGRCGRAVDERIMYYHSVTHPLFHKGSALPQKDLFCFPSTSHDCVWYYSPQLRIYQVRCSCESQGERGTSILWFHGHHIEQKPKLILLPCPSFFSCSSFSFSCSSFLLLLWNIYLGART